ncbi:cell death abnormality protein 1-like [Cloeon dipterum]|uniref:cell death abnormality protein 1-like n=1 Tax=Cloeon dipterum TaxID=197152 RepID=UPI0032202149
MESSLLHVFLQIFLFTLATSSDLSGLICEGNADCADIAGSTCNTNLKLCECSGNQILSSTMQKCLAVVHGAGDACEEDVQCSAALLNGGTCQNGKCGCTDGMHYLRGRCWTSKALGADCNSDDECASLVEANSVQCLDNKCQCAEGFYQREYSDCRKRVENIGEPCALNSDCTYDGGFCNTSKLCDIIAVRGKLKVNHKVTKSNNTFMHAATKRGNKELGAACSSDPECSTLNSECPPSGYCKCKTGFFKSPTEDKCIPEIGGPCTQNEDCVIKGSSCDGSVCVCGMGTAASATKQECLNQTIAYNRRCSEISQCTLFGTRVECKSNGGSSNCVCGASSRHIVEDNICWIVKGPGQECSDERDCSVPYKTNEFSDMYIDCVGNKCTCNEGYHPSSDGSNCNLDAPDLGDTCTENSDCQVGNSICDTKTKMCVCKTGYYADSEGACAVGVGGSCSVSEDCASVANSECTANKCQCPAGWTSNLAISECLPITNGLNEECAESQQCTPSLGEFGECRDELCQCQKKHHLVLGTCTPSKGLGDDCSKGYECFLPVSTEGLVCRNNKCSCDYGLVPAENNAYCTGSAARATVGFFTLTVAFLLVSLK